MGYTLLDGHFLMNNDCKQTCMNVVSSETLYCNSACAAFEILPAETVDGILVPCSAALLHCCNRRINLGASPCKHT